MTMHKKSRWLILLLILPHLLGCAVTAIGGGTAAGAVTLDRRTAGTIIEDQSIELKAYEAIRTEKELDEQTHINITSYDTAVLVTGESPLDEMREKIISIVSNIEKIMYSSIHFPKCGNVKDLNAWKYYGYEDFKFILSKMKNMKEGYLIGDFNMPFRILNEFLLSFKDYKFKILAQNGVDYIIRVDHF